MLTRRSVSDTDLKLWRSFYDTDLLSRRFNMVTRRPLLDPTLPKLSPIPMDITRLQLTYFSHRGFLPPADLHNSLTDPNNSPTEPHNSTTDPHNSLSGLRHPSNTETEMHPEPHSTSEQTVRNSSYSTNLHPHPSNTEIHPESHFTSEQTISNSSCFNNLGEQTSNGRPVRVIAISLLRKFGLGFIFPIFLYIIGFFICCVLFLLPITPFALKDPKGFKGSLTNATINSVYFHVVTFTTIGFGDVTPIKPKHKITYCFAIIGGVCLFNCFISSMVTLIFDYLTWHKRIWYIFIFVFASVMIGVTGIYLIEDIGFLHSCYLAIMSMTTVGYGDVSFTSRHGRMLSPGWFLASIISWNIFLKVVSMMMEFLVEKYIRRRDLTIGDSLFADLDREETVRKCFHILNKLKDLGKTTASEIRRCGKDFDSREHSIPRDLECGIRN